MHAGRNGIAADYPLGCLSGLLFHEEFFLAGFFLGLESFFGFCLSLPGLFLTCLEDDLHLLCNTVTFFIFCGFAVQFLVLLFLSEKCHFDSDLPNFYLFLGKNYITSGCDKISASYL